MAKTEILTNVYPALRQYLAAFIKDYAVKDNDGWKSKALRLKYLFSETDTEDVPNNKYLAQLLGVTSESVRKNTKDLSAEFCDELNARQDEAFLSLKGIKRIELKDNLMKRFGFGHDEKTLRFYLDGMDYTVSEEKGYDGFCIDTSYYGKGLKGILKAVIPDVKDILAGNPVPVRMEVVLAQLKADGFDMLRLRFAEDYMLADTDTYKVEEQDGYTFVSMKWNALPSVTARQVSILYDFALENGSDAFMAKRDLMAKYNTRAYLYEGIEQLDENQSVAKNDHIEFGGNGTYRYIGKPRNKGTRTDLKAELLRYLAEHDGIAPYTDLRQFVDNNGWNYKEVTIKKYLKEDCEAAWIKGQGKRTYYILKTCWPEYQKKGYYRPGVGQGTGRSSQPPAYKVAIIDRAVALLKETKGNTLPKKTLFDAVVDLYPKKSKNNIYKIFDEDPSFVKIGDAKGDFYALAPDLGDA